MRIKWGQDMATALLFILVGVGALIIGWDYSKGRHNGLAREFCRRSCRGALSASGASWRSKPIIAGDVAMSPWAWRPLFMVTLACGRFRHVRSTISGLIVTMIIALTLCAARHDRDPVARVLDLSRASWSPSAGARSYGCSGCRSRHGRSECRPNSISQLR